MGPISELNSLPLLTPQAPLSPTTMKPAGKDRRQTRASKESSIERRMRERRAAPRLEVELECEEELSAEQRYFRVTWDLSPFGLSTRYGYPHPLGTKIKLSLHLPGEEAPVRLKAEVVGQFPENTGVRLAFRSPTREAVRRISEYLKARST